MKVISSFSIIFSKASIPLGFISACIDVFAPLLDYSSLIAILSMFTAGIMTLLWFKKYRREVAEGEKAKHWSFASMVVATTASFIFGLLALLHQNTQYEGKGILATHIPALGNLQASISENLHISQKVHADTTHLKREIAALKQQLAQPEQEKRAKLLKKIETSIIPGVERSIQKFGLNANLEIDKASFEAADLNVLEELNSNLFTIGSALYTIVKHHQRDPNISEADSQIFQQKVKKISLRHNPKHQQDITSKFTNDGTLSLESDFSQLKWKPKEQISFASYLAMTVVQQN